MSNEKKLACQAVNEIRIWLERKKSTREGGGPRLAVKFCGGCNPVLDRSLLVQKIREGLAEVSWVSWEENSDLVIIVNGCLTACAERDEIEKRSSAIMCIDGDHISGIEKGNSGRGDQ